MVQGVLYGHATEVAAGFIAEGRVASAALPLGRARGWSCAGACTATAGIIARQMASARATERQLLIEFIFQPLGPAPPPRHWRIGLHNERTASSYRYREMRYRTSSAVPLAVFCAPPRRPDCS